MTGFIAIKKWCGWCGEEHIDGNHSNKNVGAYITTSDIKTEPFRAECTKVKYATEAYALADIKRIKKESDRDEVPVRAYKCTFCSGWHLTKVASTHQMLKRNIKDLQEEIQVLKDKITAKDLIIKFRNQNEKTQINLEIQKDDRIKIRDAKIREQNKTIKSLRQTISTLVSKLPNEPKIEIIQE